jgi:hypothetical protein
VINGAQKQTGSCENGKLMKSLGAPILFQPAPGAGRASRIPRCKAANPSMGAFDDVVASPTVWSGIR